ncbi:MAG: 3-deoxy-D-manno-octulosonate 8-phosphate phosphatase [Acidobacteria bacterium]|nr:3-deoxy-D-manno-octulosonate 8-phosphate phosphatase [Acidobacteriota bacterium]
MNSNYDRASKVRLLLMDVDGVLTDGRVLFLPNAGGEWTETKAFDSQDGIALQWLHWKGIKTGVISGRKSPAVEIRAKQGHMAYCYQGNIEKIPLLEEIFQDSGLKPEEVAFIGDDFTDVVIFRRVGWAVAVGNARPEVKQSAHYVTAAKGGEGALREVAEMVLKAQGYWDEILEKYEIGGIED